MNLTTLRNPQRFPSKIARRLSPCTLSILVIGVAIGCSGSPAIPSNSSSPAATSSLVGAPVGSSIGDGGGKVISPNERVELPIALVEPWKSATRDGHEMITDHFKLRVTLRNGDLRRFLPIFTERAMAQYTSALGPLPDPSRRLETYIFGTRDEWTAFTNERLGDEAGTYLGLGRGGYTSKTVAILYDIGPTDTLTILAHEGWHQYSQSVFREELPVWLEEGIATYMEGYRVDSSGRPIFSAWRNFERFGELRNAVRGEDLIPLEKLLDQTPQQFLNEGRDRLLVYYAQVWALTHFLAEGGNGKYRDALTAILRDAVAGQVSNSLAAIMTTNEDRRSVKRAISRGGIRTLPGTLIARGYFSQDLPEMADEYESFIKQICLRGSGDAIWRGISPIPKPATDSQPIPVP